jgi:hypothetical protein
VRRILAACVLLLAADPARPAWGAGGCAAVAAPVIRAAQGQAAADGWRQDARWPGWWLLYQGGGLKGAYSPAAKEWQDYGPSGWGAKFQLQAAAPAKAQGCGCRPECDCGPGCDCLGGGRCLHECLPNYGVNVRELVRQADGDAYLLNGRPASRASAFLALAGGQLADDAHKLRLTVIGPDAERKQVLADLAAAPALAEWRDKLLVQGYEPTHWATAQCGFKTDGKPTIYLQAPDGKVLHRQDDYRGGAEALAGAIRKADPDYKPEKDADRRKAPALPALPGWLPGWAPWAAGGLALLLLLRPKAK